MSDICESNLVLVTQTSFITVIHSYFYKAILKSNFCTEVGAIFSDEEVLKVCTGHWPQNPVFNVHWFCSVESGHAMAISSRQI